ncbi:MAG: hypothetical protein OXT71_06230 [Acidobacteriota bacterium]|nr:hypothetical protein [Acidobacteriota bacterium]
MGKFCCFCCPAKDNSEKSLDDSCPTCGRTYRFPLSDFPSKIRDYSIITPLGRGFYAATYFAVRGALQTKSVLKISPKHLFDFFPGKDFRHECLTHSRVAEGTEHIVDIRDMFDADIVFGDTKLSCHVAELEYVDGRLLADYLKPNSGLTAVAAAQIAIDLFNILDELRKKDVNHNDLHAENIIIKSLGSDSRRAGAIDETIRAIAIDLGSISDDSKSDSRNSRLGDLHWIAEHLRSLVENLLYDPDEISDLDARLASALQLIAQSITPNTENQRTPSSTDFIDQIEDAFYRVAKPWRPWQEPLSLKVFNASYNAQTMQAWHVPQLLVDTDGQWLNTISSPGPQVITGMRGCGKTMLLRALQFHARAAQREEESNGQVLKRLKRDNYVGIFVSAHRLLDRLGDDTETTHVPFARLLVAFGLEAVKAVHHLYDIDQDSVSQFAYKYLVDTIAGYIRNSDDLTYASSIYDLERRLIRLLISMSRGERDYSLVGHPNTAFPRLAEAIRRCSPIWQNAQVLFLLDDVSTRYLNQPRIEQLLSALLFQSPSCAFKLTSEAQTIELGLKSPGEIHPARVGRDLNVFDLGAEVYGKIKRHGRGNGRDFVERILSQRANYFAAHPVQKPTVLLGDVPLETIAAEIGASTSSSRERKKIYRGITALARMCVGDIGDVISLYEQILKKASGQMAPIKPEIQSDCFQDFSARRLYDLNRRRGYLKDVAKSFAEASYSLLINSCKESPFKTNKNRIRQYSSLYVRITTGDFEKQTERLRDLIDAGVFVFAGGSSVPRTKTRDGNPTQQFKLTYRKIYGLVNFIGLAERDRFELSGADLEEWLSKPSKGKEILLRNLGGSDSDEGTDKEARTPPRKEEPIDVDSNARGNEKRGLGVTQPRLFDRNVPSFEIEILPATDPGDASFLGANKPAIRHLEYNSISDFRLDWIVVGLGFEERSLESVRRLCTSTRPRNALTVAYREPGNGTDITSILEKSVERCVTENYEQIIDNGLPRNLDGNVMIDITGLAKPVIFHAVRDQLRHNRHVWVWHTEAESYYPLDGDLAGIVKAEDDSDLHILLEELSRVLTGETGPYISNKLLPSDYDNTRQRVLCAFSSPKHERLFSLLDSREYDRIEIITANVGTPRSKVAQIAADIAARNNTNSYVINIDSNDYDGVLRFITERYRYWYINHGLNFEFGLTGSKIQAVACAAASAAFKISQCWYLRPQRFDPERFTKGVGESHAYEISLKQ